MRALGVLLLLAVFLVSAHAAREYRIVPGFDIPGNDIRSPDGKTPYTKVCTPAGGYKGKMGYDAFKQYCEDTPKCVAAVAPSAPDGCAYLKTKGVRAVTKADPKWVVVTSAEKPQRPCAFSQLGGPCTTDPWVELPVCCGGNKNPCVNGVCVSGFPSNPAPTKSPRVYRFVYQHLIQGYDIPSPDGKTPFTRVCTPPGGYKGKTGYDALQLYCDEHAKCVAVVGDKDQCGYLKTKGTRDATSPDPNFFVLTSAEKPQRPCAFSQLGGPCTTDPWVELPVCCGGNKNPCVNGVCVSGYPSGH